MCRMLRIIVLGAVLSGCGTATVRFVSTSGSPNGVLVTDGFSANYGGYTTATDKVNIGARAGMGEAVGVALGVTVALGLAVGVGVTTAGAVVMLPSRVAGPSRSSLS